MAAATLEAKDRGPFKRLALTGLPMIVAAALIFYLSKSSTAALFQPK
jgi:hypothetical protein